VGFNQKIDLIAEMSVLAAAMFLAAFFCFRVMLLPKATEGKVDRIYEASEILPKR
jgi:hypothetical protein